MTPPRLTLLIFLAAASGCADEVKSEKPSAVSFAPGRLPVTVAERGNLEIPNAKSAEGPTSPVPMPPTDAPPAAKLATTPRKIIYSADLSLVVEDFPRTADAVASLVGKFGGYVADTDIAGATGNHRRATWKVRVPVDRFDSFLDAVAKLGELQRRQIHSQDVTEEFFDLEARIKNKKVEEGRLVTLLTESTGKLKDILDVEREISRVREEVERMEGRVRLLANLSDLTTVTIVVDERVGFVPETAPSFGTKAARTLEASTKGLKDFFEGLALLAISVVPWVPVWLVAGLVVLFLLRRIRRRYFSAFPSPPRPTPA